MRILVVGNCQRLSVVAALSHLLPGAEVSAALCNAPLSESLRGQRVDVLINQQEGPENIAAHEVTADLVLDVPHLLFTGFQPDMAYIKVREKHLGPSSPYSSRLVMFGFLAGLSEAQCLHLFDPRVYYAVGWQFDKAVTAFLTRHDKRRDEMADHLTRWAASGCFMYTINHPHLRAVSDLTSSALVRAGIACQSGNAADHIADPHAGQRWPALPGIAYPPGFSGSSPLYQLQRPVKGKPPLPLTMTLAEYIAYAYRQYHDGGLSAAEAEVPSFNFTRMQANLAPFLASLSPKQPTAKSVAGNPYRGLADYHYWRQAVAEPAPEALNPMVNAPFKLSRTDKIATAGSCFAQHIARRLAASGYSYLVSEPAPTGLGVSEGTARNYGLFSARYGNIYTPRQMRQLVERATGEFRPLDEAWDLPEGRCADPFRPQIEPTGFASREGLRADRAAHLAAVLSLFRQADVFVFTLGLTEAWQRLADGAVFPIAPGVITAALDPRLYGFVNFSFTQCRDDLVAFIAAARGLNPRLRFILTVSPVPLVATYEDRHVLVSTVASKSILRAVADEVARKVEDVMYFPSYEIIASHVTAGRYFAADQRSVTPQGVDHVMRVFFDTCCAQNQQDSAADDLETLHAVVCDEELLDQP